MNFRHTALLFGLCLTMLWLFGFMLAYKKVVVEASYIVPTMQRAEKDDIESVTIQRQTKDKAKEEFTFVRINDLWYYEEGGQRLRVENFNITKIIDALKDAKKNDNAAVQARNLALYDLNNPTLIVTVKAHLKKDNNREKEWKFYYGKDSPDGLFAYVNSSDAPERVFAVDKNRLEALFFKDPHHLRSKRLFNFGNPTEVSALELKKGAGVLEITKNDEGVWRIQKPPLGFADFEGVTPDPKSLAPPPKTETGIKGLISAISHIQVDVEEDFLPPGELGALLLEDGKEVARIQVTSPPERAFLKEEKEKKEPVRETLLIGKKLEKADKYYGRLLGDQGAFLINAKYLEPIFQAIKDPSSLRGMDMLPIDTKNVDYIALSPGGPEITLFHPEGKSWHLVEAKGKPEKAGDKAVQDLLEALQGKRQIQKFHDADDGDAKKIDDQLGLSAPVAEATLYIHGLDKTKKEDNKEEKKDDKKATKKDEKKDDMVEAPKLVKDAKPAVKLTFGKTEGDIVWVKRDLGDKNISRFALPKAILDRVRPADARLAFLDTALPPLNQTNITHFDLIRGDEKLELEVAPPHGWTFKGQPATGSNPIKSFDIIMAIDKIAKADAKKWLKKIDPKDDLNPYGLTSPSLVARFTIKTEQPITPKGAAAFFADDNPWLVAAAYLAYRATDKVEVVTLKFGKETDQEKDKPGVFARHSGTDVLFLAPTDLVKYLRELDVRDRSVVFTFQPVVNTGLIGQVAAQPLGGLVLAAPLAANQVLQFDPAKVKVLKLAVRTKEELRNFTFQKNPKDKTWSDQSGLQEFNLDSDKVNQLLEEWSKLKAERLVGFGGPKVEHKLSPLEAALRAEIYLEDGRSFNLTVGGLFEQRQYFAHSSAWPELVFFVIANRVEPFLRGVGHFAKERLAGGP